MMLDSRPCVIPDAPVAVRANAACNDGPGQRTEGAKVEHRTVGDVPPQHWADLLVRVRDGQDRAAFAALFRHFAPRVKGFLMKAGTPEPVADLKKHLPKAYKELDRIRTVLEKHFKDIQDFEFTIQDPDQYWAVGEERVCGRDLPRRADTFLGCDPTYATRADCER